MEGGRERERERERGGSRTPIRSVTTLYLKLLYIDNNIMYGTLLCLYSCY